MVSILHRVGLNQILNPGCVKGDVENLYMIFINKAPT